MMPSAAFRLLVHVGSGITFCLLGPVSKAAPGVQGVWMVCADDPHPVGQYFRVFWAKDPLADGQQRRVLVARGGSGRILAGTHQ
jgi:hypothetical protein